MPSNGAKTSPEAVEVAQKRARALELRMEGKTFEEIAQEAGYNSRQAAHLAVTTAIEMITKPLAHELLILDLERLDKMWGMHYLNAQAGDVQALNGCLRIMERRARMLGIDAPVKSEVKSEVTAMGGVLAIPGMLDEDAWVAKAKASQAALAEKENKVIAAGAQQKTRRRVIDED